ncbi:aminotransferase AlaT [Flammeovirgaceae bacterium 311]|nr:aminotransferase AlaT [Flammeovirgaceae bacterium 311]
MIQRNTRLDSVHYELQGPLYEKAKELEAQGHQILKLNLGNPAPFGFNAPPHIVAHIVENLSKAQGYADYRGLLSAREAIRDYYTGKGVEGVAPNDIMIGNGVSELVFFAIQALLNEGDEVLVPTPDYPLWTASVNFSGGKTVHYLCDEASGWYPDLADIRRKITSRTRAIVLINPNNPTGAVYPPEILHQLVRLAEEHQLVVFSDEIYDKILYEDAVHYPTARFAETALVVTFSGLSKNYLSAGYRAGWLLVSGNKKAAGEYIKGLNILASLRVCSNVPAQYAIEVALKGHQSMDELVLPTGRLRQQRDLCYEMLTAIPGISCIKPMGAFYMFPKIDIRKFKISSDLQFALDFLEQQQVLLVQGSGFNWPVPDHFRVVYLPAVEEISKTMNKLSGFLESYQQQSSVPA